MKESDLSSDTSSIEEEEPNYKTDTKEQKEQKKYEDKMTANINSVKDEFVEINISGPDPPKLESNEKIDNEVVRCSCSLSRRRQCLKTCKERCLSFYCGHNMSYFSCVLTRGFFPGIIWFIVYAIISGVVWGVKGGTVGMIIGIVFLCLAIVGPILFITFAACYAYYYPSNDIGSKGCCPWVC